MGYDAAEALDNLSVSRFWGVLEAAEAICRQLVVRPSLCSAKDEADGRASGRCGILMCGGLRSRNLTDGRAQLRIACLCHSMKARTRDVVRLNSELVSEFRATRRRRRTAACFAIAEP